MSEIGKLNSADVLVQALPYIKKYYGRIVVIKYGGSSMINKELKEQVMIDVVLLSLVGIKVVLVHGGGPEINDMLNKVGKESRFVNGLRYTDEETIDIVQMVLSGKVNKELVHLLNMNGGKAIGLSGIDGNMMFAEKYKKVDIGFVGELTKVDSTAIKDALSKDYIPVVSTVAAAADNEKEIYNINADTAAAALAADLGAEKFILMTDTPGILRDKDDQTSLIPEIELSSVAALKNSGIISGGMIPKVECCVEASRRGVKQTNIIDGRVPHSILIEMLTHEGSGTMFVN
ncbi:MAG: acetylglutamate kinase [bacterium]|nr:acetylglutamate kinase [bacterium]